MLILNIPDHITLKTLNLKALNDSIINYIIIDSNNTKHGYNSQANSQCRCNTRLNYCIAWIIIMCSNEFHEVWYMCVFDASDAVACHHIAAALCTSIRLRCDWIGDCPYPPFVCICDSIDFIVAPLPTSWDPTWPVCTKLVGFPIIEGSILRLLVGGVSSGLKHFTNTLVIVAFAQRSTFSGSPSDSREVVPTP